LPLWRFRQLQRKLKATEVKSAFFSLCPLKYPARSPHPTSPIQRGKNCKKMVILQDVRQGQMMLNLEKLFYQSQALNVLGAFTVKFSSQLKT
jgi:hypothetical protein